MNTTNKNKAAWVQRRERSNTLTLQLMSWISLKVGRRFSRLLLYPIALYFLLFSPSGRKSSKDYLTLALGQKPSWKNAFWHFFYFAATIHDRIYLINQRFDLFEIEIHGKETILPLITSGQGIFLMGAHLGSFEALRAVGRQLPGLRIAMVMHEDNAQKINAMLAAINPAAAQDIIGLGHIDSMLQVNERLEGGMLVGMLSDRTLGDEPMAGVELLGARAAMPIGPFRMAALMRRPVLFMTALYMGSNRYRIHFDELADFSRMQVGEREKAVSRAIHRYTELVEHYCRLTPYNWFNFYDYWLKAPQHQPNHKPGRT